MHSPRSSARVTGWVVLGSALATPALGAHRTCEEVTLSAHPLVVARWPDLRQRVERGLTDRHDIDRCASVHLGPSGDGLTLQVTLQDGRSAERWVPSSEDVIPGLEALLLLPAPELTASVPDASALSAAKPSLRKPSLRKPSVPKPSTPKQPVPAEAPLSLRDPGLEPESANAGTQPDRGVGATLALGGGVRMGDGQSSSNLGVMATVILWDWLVGFEARAASYEVPVSDRVPQAALELSAVGGRRFGSGTFGLDLLLGPTLLFQQDVVVHEDPGGRASKTTTSRVLPRLFAASRLTIGARSIVGGFVGIEGAVGPSGASDINAPDVLPPLPVWMLGLVVGAMVGAP